ncbi:MAG: T9SS type A sorting domain-containing protein [Lentimicrobium sp.]|nr:T9SS type A sorting domain-containing protein [Lentimicrobium sp.]
MKILKYAFLMVLITTQLKAQDLQFTGSEFCAYGKQMRPDINISEFRSPNSPKHSFDVLNYELDLDIYHCYSSPYPKSFTASSTVTFRVDTALSQIKLNAVNSSLQISSVGLSAVSFSHIQDTLTIELDQLYQPGSIVDVSIEYSHLNVSDLAFYADNGFVFTDCEPQGARKWFPCYDHPSDKATLSLRAKVPSNVKLGSNGRLADSLTIADTTWYTWISRDPVATYIMVISSRVNYNLDIVNWQKPGSDEVLPIRFYYNPGENPTSMKQMIIPLANYFYSIFGDHPFEKDGFATLSPQFQWGGMENQSLTSLCPNCWYSSLITHEFAHQWFGDMITCATWADLWLNEGFATFSAALWVGEVSGPQAYKNELISNANYYLGQNPGWPISNPEWAFTPPSNSVLFNYAITYMKASCVLHMYRYLVGDTLFFNSIYEYATDTSNFRYKTATIGDFTDKVSEVTGQDLHWFFDQWLLQPNHPVYDNSYSFKDMGNGNWNVNFLTSQVQTNAPFFKMPLELRITFENATDTLVRLMNNENNEFFALEFNKRPITLVFDPDNNILLKQSSTVVSNEYIQTSPQIHILIEPNPAKESVELKFRLETEATVSLVIYDMKGNRILKNTYEQLSQGRHNKLINTRNFAVGTYLVSLQTDAGKSVGTKLVIIE